MYHNFGEDSYAGAISLYLYSIQGHGSWVKYKMCIHMHRAYTCLIRTDHHNQGIKL